MSENKLSMDDELIGMLAYKHCQDVLSNKKLKLSDLRTFARTLKIAINNSPPADFRKRYVTLLALVSDNKEILTEYCKLLEVPENRKGFEDPIELGCLLAILLAVVQAIEEETNPYHYDWDSLEKLIKEPLCVQAFWRIKKYHEVTQY